MKIVSIQETGLNSVLREKTVKEGVDAKALVPSDRKDVKSEGADSREKNVDTRLSKLEEVIKDVAEEIRVKLDRKIEMVVDKESRKIIVKVLNGETNEVIRQIPPEEVIALSKRLKEIQGVLFDKEV